ncbi:MAG: hypothetical protein [Olavius algarvensis Delta 4 endosymbiont]|nr:MAG: hypothetical protein [Olavius algarvensis Delta 4 endosymbiont]
MYRDRSSDRRSGLDRRVSKEPSYSGPERRQLKYRRIGIDRRGSLPAVCIYCGSVRDSQGDWTKDQEPLHAGDNPRTGICIECSKEKFPQFYTAI